MQKVGRVFVVVDSNRGSAWEWEFWWWVWVVGGIAGENLMTVVCDGGRVSSQGEDMNGIRHHHKSFKYHE